jgi:hypothetical protein
MRSSWARAVLLVALAVAPRVAFAEDPPAPAPVTPPKPETSAPAEVPRIHSAHTVDVIAPGEKVETIIERLRGRMEHAPPPTPSGEKVAPPQDGKARPRDRRPGAPDLPGGNRGGPPKLGPGSGPPMPGGMRPPMPPGGGMTPPPLPPAPPPPMPPHP